MSTGGGYACAIRTGGTLWCWGDALSGQLGIGQIVSYEARPQQVTGRARRMASGIGGWPRVDVRGIGQAGQGGL